MHERRVFIVDECRAPRLGAFLRDFLTRLLHQWNFPESIIAAVSTHHTPATAPNRPKRLAALAYAGNILAYRIGLGYGFPQYAALPEPACLRLIDLTPDGLEEYENEVLHSFQREQERFV